MWLAPGRSRDVWSRQGPIGGIWRLGIAKKKRKQPRYLFLRIVQLCSEILESVSHQLHLSVEVLLLRLQVVPEALVDELHVVLERLRPAHFLLQGPDLADGFLEADSQLRVLLLQAERRCRRQGNAERSKSRRETYCSFT